MKDHSNEKINFVTENKENYGGEITEIIENNENKTEKRLNNFVENYCLLFEEFEKLRLSKIINPEFKDEKYMNSNKAKIPFSPESSEEMIVIYDNLDWSEFKWGENSLCVKEKYITNLKNYKFFENK